MENFCSLVFTLQKEAFLCYLQKKDAKSTWFLFYVEMLYQKYYVRNVLLCELMYGSQLLI